MIFLIALTAIYALQDRQTISLYLDGVFTARADDSLTVVKDWHELQAIHVEDPSIGADVYFLSSSSNGIRTDGTSWRCSNQYHEGWFLPNFTDHSWPRPYVSDSDTFFIAPDAQWIAYLLAQSNKIFCRRSTVGKRHLVYTIHQINRLFYVVGQWLRTIEKAGWQSKRKPAERERGPGRGNTLSFYNNTVSTANAEYSYFSANLRLKPFLWIFLDYSVWHFCCCFFLFAWMVLK